MVSYQLVGMSTAPAPPPAMPEKKARLIEAGIKLVLQRGYAGMTVDLICAEAGVTKGSFFHYFTNKEDIGLAVLDAWMMAWEGIVASAHLDTIDDPLDRLEALFDVMTAAYAQEKSGLGCVVGTVAQEVSPTNRALGDRCQQHLERWADQFASLLDDAKKAHPPTTDFDSHKVARLFLSIVQGSMLVSKTEQDCSISIDNVALGRDYIRSLFGKSNRP